MADDDQPTFPRANLNPSAAPWGRAVEKRITAMDTLLARVRQQSSSSNRILASGKGLTADGSVYRANGVFAANPSGDFTVVNADGEDDTVQYASLNLQPGFVALRAQNNPSYVDGAESGSDDGILRLGPRSFQVLWGSLPQHDIDSTTNDLMSGHAAISYQIIDVEGAADFARRLDVANGWLSMQDSGLIEGTTEFNIGDWIVGTVATDPDGGDPIRTLTIFDSTFKSNGTGSVGGGGGTPATHTAAGIVRLANTDEMANGTDDTTAVTPVQVALAIANAIPTDGGGGGGTALADLWRGEWVQYVDPTIPATHTYGFETPVDADGTPYLGPEWTTAIDASTQAIATVVGTDFIEPGTFSAHDSAAILVLLAITENTGFVEARITATFSARTAWAFDWANGGGDQDRFTLSVLEDPAGDATTGVVAGGYGFSDWQNIAGTSPAGTHTFVFRFTRGVGTPDNPFAVVDNFTMTNAVIDGAAPASPPYLRSHLTRHLGGLYLCLTDNAATEPGPGDTADWAELVARPS